MRSAEKDEEEEEEEEIHFQRRKTLNIKAAYLTSMNYGIVMFYRAITFSLSSR
jgi:hypothetical protein